MAYYFVLKYPKLAMAAVIALVTAVLIIGYELQVRTLGLEIATANGQPGKILKDGRVQFYLKDSVTLN